MTKQPIKILLVEDEMAHVTLIARAFEDAKEPWRVINTRTLKEAKSMLAKQQPDLMLLDNRLPDGEGITLLKKGGKQQVFPIIIMTAYGDEKMAVEAMKSGALDYIVKSESVFADMPHVAERTLREWKHITERVRVEAELKLSEERFSLAMEGANEGLWDWDLKTDQIFLSKRWKSMLGYRDNELENSFETWERLVHSDDLKPVKQSIDNYLSGKTSEFKTEFRMKHKEGHWIDILSRGFAVSDQSGGNYIRFVGTHVDISERKQAEESLRQSEATIRNKLKAILEPEGDIGSLELSDIIDIEVLQNMMQEFYQLTGMLGAILDVSGNVLIAIGWQDICTKFHRCHPETLKNCIESDTILTSGVEEGAFKTYHCKNNMWDMVTPIMVGGKHLGNVFIGQFFYTDEVPDVEMFRKQARDYKFDEKEYLAALARVPHFSRKELDIGMQFYANLASIISSLSFSSIQQSRLLAEQERSATLLHQQEELYRSVIQDLPALVCRNLPDGKIEFVNEAYCNYFGKSRGELLGNNFLELVPENEREHVRLNLSALSCENSIMQYEHQVVDSDGEVRWQRWTNRAICNQQDQVSMLQAFGQDITEQKNNELKLKKSEIFLKTVIEKSPFPMWISDEQAYLVSINRACRELLHITKEEVLGKYNILKDNIVKEQGLLPQVESVYQQGKQVNFKIKWAAESLKGLDFADSIAVELDVTITPIVNDNGKITNAIIQIIDITQLKKVERELSVAFEQMEKKVAERTQELSISNERLKELDQLKSLFIASMSHELRTPLNSIIGFTGVMRMEKMGTLNDKQRDYLERVSASGKHLLNLITDVIDVSKIEAGKIDIYPEKFNLLELVEKARSNLVKDAKEKGLSIRINIPNITLNTDKKRLLQCLLNYLSNAVKYSETGEICITAITEGNNIKINVRDEGIGIAEKDIEKLFRQFSRIDSPLSRSTPGTGLGLYLTNMMVTQILDGELGVESHLGKGSNFWMKIPMELTT